ncbi:MAG: ABC transporter substrate-binding protein [Oscillospiraceae bacterium]
MKNAKKLLALLLALIMCVGLLAGCSDKTDNESNTDVQNPDDTQKPTEEENTTPLVVGYSPFNSKFSPFFSETAYDQDVYAMTQISLLSSDRTGAIIYKGIEGETIAYNGTDYTYYGPADLVVTENPDGTVYYDFTLRDDITFSDGTPLTVDDVIFTMYVLCDPTYDGNSTLYAQPIEGLAEYRSGMDTLFNLLAAAGEDNTDFTYWDEATQTAFWADLNQAGEKFAQEIVDYVVAAYAEDYAESYFGYTADEVNESEGLQVAFGMIMWGFGDFNDDGLFIGAVTGTTYDLDNGEYPTAADYWENISLAYEGDYATASSTESAGSSLFDLMENYSDYTVGVQTGDSAANISGIQKTGDNSLRVVMTKVDATAIYQLGVSIAPLHYYGDASLYDYDNNSFGFPKGDLSSVRAVTTKPMGAGPYKFIKFENGTVYFEANESYYLGAPKTKYVNFLEVQEADKLNGVTTGTIDITDPTFSKDAVAAIEAANSNGETTGDVVTTNTVDNLGYGYIGMSAYTMNVGGEGASDASKALRKAFGTIFSVYRDVAIDSYYGERASVINYPISNTSWAAPQPTDDGYKVAFSVDVDGNDIYTSNMDADAKYAAAKEAALGFFEAAGYTVADGKVTAAPDGAKMEYTIWIPADGVGDHPSFMICTLAKEALAELGITLTIKDLTQSSELWTSIEAHQVDMWCAAWGATVDPDMYQIYYSDVANADGNGANPLGGPEQGGSNYMYCIADEELDQLIMDARSSTDQTYRKAMYKACLDIVIDWAVEIPVYQRQNAIIFSTERVNMDTVTPDITTFYGWMSEIENIELN